MPSPASFALLPLLCAVVVVATIVVVLVTGHDDGPCPSGTRSSREVESSFLLLLVTSATLVVTSAILVVTRS